MFIIMPFMALVYTYIWTVLIKWIVLIAGYFFSWLLIVDGKQPHERAYALACGKLSGTVFEISRAYMFFWPEYEGKSSWEKGFTNNKKGCDANLTSLDFQLLWPSMEPAYTMEMRPGFINVSLYPAQNRVLDARFMIDYIIKDRQVADDQRGKFNEQLGLFYELYATVPSYLDQGRVALYWTDAEAIEQVIIECIFIQDVEPYRCDQKWMNDGIGSTVDIYYSPEMIKEWKNIKKDVDRFLAEHKK